MKTDFENFVSRQHAALRHDAQERAPDGKFGSGGGGGTSRAHLKKIANEASDKATKAEHAAKLMNGDRAYLQAAADAHLAAAHAHHDVAAHPETVGKASIRQAESHEQRARELGAQARRAKR